MTSFIIPWKGESFTITYIYLKILEINLWTFWISNILRILIAIIFFFNLGSIYFFRDGILSNLENLQCFQWEVCLETMLFIIDQCPVLRHIWGLDLLMLSPQSITAIQQHITKNNRHIDLHDGMSTSDDSSTKG